MNASFLAAMWYDARPGTGPSTPVSGWVVAGIFIFVLLVAFAMFSIYRRKKRTKQGQ